MLYLFMVYFNRVSFKKKVLFYALLIVSFSNFIEYFIHTKIFLKYYDVELHTPPKLRNKKH